MAQVPTSIPVGVPMTENVDASLLAGIPLMAGAYPTQFNEMLLSSEFFKVSAPF